MLRKRNSLFFIAICSSMFLLSACQKNEISSIAKPYYSFTDDLGLTVTLSQKPEKVVSLFGSFAETWLLAGGELAGTTNDTQTERELVLSENVKFIGSVKEPNIEEILNLSPDFVLLSADIESHKKISETLKELKIPYAFFKVEQFDDYLNMLKICTDITEKNDLYKENGLEIKAQIEQTIAKVDFTKKPSILFIRSFSTGSRAIKDDNITAEIMTELGCDNIATRHESLIDTLSIEEIILEDPDFIFVVTMGSSDEKALETLKNGVEKNPAWNELSAVKNDRYIILPKNLFHYKPNAKWGEAYEYLEKILYE